MPAKLIYPFDRSWSLEQAVQLACLLEASAPKVGNVHPGASFTDMHFAHFVASSIAIRDVFANAASLDVGDLVLQSVLATQDAVGCNTNLGTLLLFAPLAKARVSTSASGLRQRVVDVLQGLQASDSQAVYAAIRAAQPGGLGQQQRGDVSMDAPEDLVAAMVHVADVDAVARQYTNGFADIFERLVPWFETELLQTGDPLEAICQLQLQWLAHEPDGLIVRKVGQQIAEEVQQRATAALTRSDQRQQLDHYLRADGHRRNPGTTADLIAASILVVLLAK